MSGDDNSTAEEPTQTCVGDDKPGAGDAPDYALDDAAVIQFLEAEPEFFARHPELTTALTVPHAMDGAS